MNPEFDPDLRPFGPKSLPRFVVCAALRQGDVIVAGARHFDKVMLSQIALMNLPKKWEQGFIDQYGNFLTRSEAWIVADHRGQIRRPTGFETDYNSPRPANFGDNGLLFSENLY